MNAGMGSPMQGTVNPLGTSQHQGQWGVQGGRPLGDPAARMMNHPGEPMTQPRLGGSMPPGMPMLGQALMGMPPGGGPPMGMPPGARPGPMPLQGMPPMPPGITGGMPGGGRPPLAGGPVRGRPSY